ARASASTRSDASRFPARPARSGRGATRIQSASSALVGAAGYLVQISVGRAEVGPAKRACAVDLRDLDAGGAELIRSCVGVVHEEAAGDAVGMTPAGVCLVEDLEGVPARQLEDGEPVLAVLRLQAED